MAITGWGNFRPLSALSVDAPPRSDRLASLALALRSIVLAGRRFPPFCDSDHRWGVGSV